MDLRYRPLPIQILIAKNPWALFGVGSTGSFAGPDNAGLLGHSEYRLVAFATIPFTFESRVRHKRTESALTALDAMLPASWVASKIRSLFEYIEADLDGAGL